MTRESEKCCTWALVLIGTTYVVVTGIALVMMLT